MNFDRILWCCIGLFLFLFGLFHVTNIKVVWGEPVLGFAAVIAGVLAFVKAWK